MNERPHKKLKLWEKVMSVIEEVYDMTDTYPKQESYGLSMQMRRSAVSIASNIAEGAAAKVNKRRSSSIPLQEVP
jgi:four helix bundle protein